MIQSQITKPPDKIRPKVADFPGLGGILMPPWLVLSQRPARPLPGSRRAILGRARAPSAPQCRALAGRLNPMPRH